MGRCSKAAISHWKVDENNAAAAASHLKYGLFPALLQHQASLGLEHGTAIMEERS